MNISTFYRNFDRQGFLRGVFILSVAFECILIGMLIAGEFTSNRTFPQSLSAEEVGHYKQYSIVLPNAGGRRPDTANVLAQCTFQEEKIIGDERYKFYTSDVLPQYIYRCSSIREIMETSVGAVYITYISYDAEEVILTIGGGGIIQKDIYAAKTDTYYVFSELKNYKFPHYRHQHFGFLFIKILAVGIGFVLAFVFALRTKGRAKKGNVPEI